MHQLMLQNLLETITNRIKQNHGMMQESCQGFADNHDAVQAELVHQLSRHQLSSLNARRPAVQEQTPLNNYPAGLGLHRHSQDASDCSELSFNYNQASFTQALHMRDVYPFSQGNSQELMWGLAQERPATPSLASWLSLTLGNSQESDTGV